MQSLIPIFQACCLETNVLIHISSPMSQTSLPAGEQFQYPLHKHVPSTVFPLSVNVTLFNGLGPKPNIFDSFLFPHSHIQSLGKVSCRPLDHILSPTTYPPCAVPGPGDYHLLPVSPGCSSSFCGSHSFGSPPPFLQLTFARAIIFKPK